MRHWTFDIDLILAKKKKTFEPNHWAILWIWAFQIKMDWLSGVFEGAETTFTWMHGKTSSFWLTLVDVFYNTWHSENNPFRNTSFGFDFELYRKYIKNTQPFMYVQTLHRDYPRLLTITAYCVGYLLMLNMLWCGVKWLCRVCSRRGRGRNVNDAMRWFKQAELDHQSSQNDMNDDNPAYEWVCFKCQQVG